MLKKYTKITEIPTRFTESELKIIILRMTDLPLLLI